MKQSPIRDLGLVPDWIPAALRAEGPLGAAWWQWLGLAAAVLVVLAASDALRGLAVRLLRRLAGRTEASWDDAVVARLRSPIRLVLVALLLPLAAAPLGLPLDAHAVVGDAARAVGLVAVVWGVLAGIGIVQARLMERANATGRTGARALIPLVSRLLRALIFVLAALALAAQFGYPVGTLLAGLGIGGIAVALGAQKTFEHLLGSVAISVDRPFMVGDWIESEGMSGAVEEIGLRSTRIRTNARTVITIPNGRLADQRIERHSARDRWLFNPTIGVAYDTQPEQLRRITADIEAWLNDTGKVSVANVRFTGFGTHALNIEVLTWFTTTDFFEFRQLRQDASFEIMRIVERHGARLAVPMQAVRIEGAPLVSVE
jgi:MscS family membrane protein